MLAEVGRRTRDRSKQAMEDSTLLLPMADGVGVFVGNFYNLRCNSGSDSTGYFATSRPIERGHRSGG